MKFDSSSDSSRFVPRQRTLRKVIALMAAARPSLTLCGLLLVCGCDTARAPIASAAPPPIVFEDANQWHGLYRHLVAYAVRHEGAFPVDANNDSNSLFQLFHDAPLNGKRDVASCLAWRPKISNEEAMRKLARQGFLEQNELRFRYRSGLRLDDYPDLVLFWDFRYGSTMGHLEPDGSKMVRVLRADSAACWVKPEEWAAFQARQERWLECMKSGEYVKLARVHNGFGVSLQMMPEGRLYWTKWRLDKEAYGTDAFCVGYLGTDYQEARPEYSNPYFKGQVFPLTALKGGRFVTPPESEAVAIEFDNWRLDVPGVVDGKNVSFAWTRRDPQNE